MKIGKPRILNVDDDAGSRYAVHRVLERAGFDVDDAASGHEALRRARDGRPDLVLLDINLPDLTGFDVCRQLKAAPETSDIPVMHITASYATTSDQVLGLETGAEAYLVEPVEPEVLVATIRAVLRARHAEEAARGLAREWQTTFDAMRDGVALVDTEGRIQRLNESMAAMLGRTRAELAGADCAKIWSAFPAKDQPVRRALERGRRETLEIEYRDRRLNITLDPIFDEEGQPAGAVQIVSDVTENRRLEEQFREAQKFETVGTLAAGVAHDFNNLLTSIMGNASLVLGEVSEANPMHGRLRDVVRASERAADLTRQLLAYSGKGRHFPQKVDISSVLHGMRSLVEAAVPKKISVSWQLTPRLPEVETDSNQLQQIVLNLVNNAAEAIGEATGCITISTGLNQDAWPYLEVADTGCGMDADTKSRIFDPFFTTKFIGRGLGLAAVAGIVRGHRGAIEVTSAPAQGSAFRVSFPRETAAPPVVEAAPKPEKITVLVVDDEEMVRRIAQASLEIRGYRVLLANNGLEAIHMAESHPEIELILLDLTMPVMGGEEAIDRIAEVQPNARVIVSTGYGQRETAARFSRKHVHAFLHKPYTSRQLTEKIESVLNARKQTA